MEPVSTSRLAFAFSAGAATFFAPCAFPLLPGYVAFYLGQGTGEGEATASMPARIGRAAAVGVLASLGFFVVYGILAGIAAAVGARALRDIAVLEPVVGGLLIALGAGLVVGLVPDLHVLLPERRQTAGGYFTFGVVYAVAAAGCTAPVFIGLALVALGSGPTGAVLILGTYAFGMAVMMIGVTLLAALGRVGLLRRLSGQTGRVSRAAGALLVLAGVAQIYLYVFDFDWLGGLRALGLV
ncbi:MAG: cytochrome c-type biogenesis protein [Natronomonas sp.]|jgi:cytochrome c-type biogenesis protein